MDKRLGVRYNLVELGISAHFGIHQRQNEDAVRFESWLSNVLTFSASAGRPDTRYARNIEDMIGASSVCNKLHQGNVHECSSSDAITNL